VFEKFKEFVNAPIKDGIRGTATVVGLSSAPDEATSGNCKMRLQVNVPGRETYNVEHQCIVKVSKWPSGGEVLPVSVDPNRPDHLRVEWDEVLTGQERLDAMYPVVGSDAAAAGAPTAALGGTPAAPAVTMTGQNPAAQAAVQAVLAQNGMGGQGVVDLRGRPEVREQVFAALEAQGIDTTAMRAAVTAREAATGAGVAASPAPSGGDPIERLEKLGKLRDSGVLSAEEFEQQKKKILEAG
jgi:hypothetical protein